MKVATSIALGLEASPKLAAKAVAVAMQKAGITTANSVLLFLTSEFAREPMPAIKAAAKTANCLQVMGCSATGIFTEEDWVLDTPAAAAMVFGGEVSLQSAKFNDTQQPLFTLTAPNAINSIWLNDGNKRFGGVSGDAIGQGPFSVWQNAKGNVTGYVDAYFTNVNVATKASHGLKNFTKPKKIHQVNGYDITLLDRKPPFAALKKAWETYSKSNDALPLHLIMATYANRAQEIITGEYNQTSVITYDEVSGHVTLAQPVATGQFLSWGFRDKITAEADLLLASTVLTKALGVTPSFGLLISCLGRGPYFYDGVDRDLKILTHQFPKMPLLGFYGNGEIASVNGENQLLPYSAVLSLFAKK